MQLDKRKIELECANQCLKKTHLIQSGIPHSTLYRAMKNGKARAETVGKIAKALGCRPCDIIEEVGK